MKPASGAWLTCALGLVAICAACNTSSDDSPAAIETDDKDRDDGEDKPRSNDKNDKPERNDNDSTGMKAEPKPGDDRPKDDDDLAPAPAVKVVGAANQSDVQSPMDATPDPDGERVYFIATTTGDSGRVGALYRANADGTDTTPLRLGAPLSAPVGIAISMDGETLFIADLSAAAEGAVLRGSADGSDLAPIAGTVGLAPRAVSVARVDDREWLYFSGQTASGAAALYRVPIDGDTPEAIAVGAPLVAPAGVMAAADGTVYTIDALADDGRAALLRVHGGDVQPVIAGLGVGFPAGLTLTKDETTALVSGLSPETGRDIVYVVDLATASLSTINDPVDAFAEPAGLHRAHNDNVFAWADSEAGDTGTVFVLSL